MTKRRIILDVVRYGGKGKVEYYAYPTSDAPEIRVKDQIGAMHKGRFRFGVTWYSGNGNKIHDQQDFNRRSLAKKNTDAVVRLASTILVNG